MMWSWYFIYIQGMSLHVKNKEFIILPILSTEELYEHIKLKFLAEIYKKKQDTV
jgi:hypothetical protein